jgi:F-type H+-transporting ATPase subunit gamma
MANSLKDIRKRIGSVKNTQKITNAMKLVSASYFARASQSVIRNRPYVEAFNGMISYLFSSHGNVESLLLEKTSEKRVLLVLVGTDRGLCGALNANNFKNALFWMQDKEDAGTVVDLVCWGRKAGAFSKKMQNKSIGTTEKVLEKPSYEKARDLANGLIERFVGPDYDAVYLAYPRFKSAIEQVPSILRLLPVDLEGHAEKRENLGQQQGEAIIEPDLSQMVDRLLERKVYGDIYQVLLDGAAAEHGARMSAMDSATTNAQEVIKKLTIKYNRARQASITTELIEIISGAESLK